MEDFELEIKREFISEGLVNLEETESAFMELETATAKEPLLDRIFRMAHNMKGGSRAVGFGDVAEFTHQLENFVLKIKKNEVPLNAQSVTLLLRCNDRMIEMLTALSADINAKHDNADLLLLLTSPILESDALPPMSPVAEAPSSKVDLSAVELPPPSADSFFKADPEPIAPTVVETAPTRKVADNDEVVRVSLAKIDLLNDFVGELIVLQSVIQEQANQTTSAKLQATIGQMSKLAKEIQDISMGLRMLPVKPLIQKLQRVVRDTSKALYKEVELQVSGDQIEVEKMVLDLLVDPLIHILRNAVDHGMEANSQDRVTAGKAPTGKISLRFQNDGNHLVIEVADDGRGIDPKTIRAKALEKGLIKASDNLTDQEAVNMIFHAGFSTKANATEVSGRGVGMDVVKTNIEKMNGFIDVQSTVGKGSRFVMQIPLSLAVIEGLIVTGVSGRFVVPLSQVQETINLASVKLAHDKSGIGTCFELRGQVVPVVALESALKIQIPKAASTQPDTSMPLIALIINVRGRPIAFAVSDIIRSQQIVVKPIDNGLIVQSGWIGTCILGDGLPTLIISPKDLLLDKFVFENRTTDQWRSA